MERIGSIHSKDTGLGDVYEQFHSWHFPLISVISYRFDGIRLNLINSPNGVYCM